ncbi:MAG: O-antigen ligase [Flavobacteriaceae bacterium]|jgi:O-antigen ligase
MKDIFYQNKKTIILKILLFIVGFSIPISLAFNSISLGVLFLFSFGFLKQESYRNLLNSKEVYLYYLVFFLIQSISIFYTSDKELGFETVKQNSVFLILPIAFINLKGQISKKSVKLVILGLYLAVISTLFIAISNLIIKAINGGIPFSEFFRESFVDNGIYDIHVPYLSMLIVFLFICIIKIDFIKNKKRNRQFKIGSLFVFIVSIFFLSGIMSILILSIFSISLFFKSSYSKTVKTVTSIFAIIIVVIGLGYLKNTKRIDHVRGSEHILYRVQNFLNSSDSTRKENWKSVTKVITLNTFFGVGADGGLQFLQRERQINSEPYINKHNAHNDILEILLRYGVFGLGIYLILIYKLSNNSIQNKDYFFKWLLVVFIISGITESYLQRQIGLTFFVFFSLLLYSNNTKIEE